MNSYDAAVAEKAAKCAIAEMLYMSAKDACLIATAKASRVHRESKSVSAKARRAREHLKAAEAAMDHACEALEHATGQLGVARQARQEARANTLLAASVK